MRAVIYGGIGSITVEDRPMPVPGPRDVVVKNMRAGICGTDIGAYQRGGDDVGIFPGNQIGHEFCSVVHDVGSEVSDERIKPGLRVWINPVNSGVVTEERSAVEVADSAGGLTQYVVIENAAIDLNLFPLPDNVTWDQGALVEPFSVANHGVNMGAPKPGQRAIVFGAGAIGTGVLCNLRANGVTDILVTDIVQNRLAVVEQLGGIPVNSKETDVIELALEKFGGTADIYGNLRPNVDLYFDAAGIPSAYADYVRGSNGAARMIVLALSGNTIEIPQAAIVLSGLSIEGSMAYTPEDNNQVIRYLAEGRYDPTPVISHHFAQEDAAAAFETAVNHKDLATKVIIDVHRDKG